MEILLNIFLGLFISLFWTAILSFIPTTLYLMVINPPIYESRAIRAMGIYILGEEPQQRKRLDTHTRGIMAIWGVCFLLAAGSYALNNSSGGHAVLSLNILSTGLVIFFAISAISYLPVMAYVLIRNPWRYKEGGLCLNGLYIGYGVCILLFSLIFAYQWLKSKGFLIGTSEIVSSLLIIIFSSLMLAYLPALAYILLTEAHLRKGRSGSHPNIIFVIYCVCFLIFSSGYSYSWIENHKKAPALNYIHAPSQ